MQTETIHKPVTRGGEFLIHETPPNDIFIPEEKNEEQQMIFQMARDFVTNEIFPIADRIEMQEEGLAVELMNKASLNRV